MPRIETLAQAEMGQTLDVDVEQDRPDLFADQAGYLEFLEKCVQRESVGVILLRGRFMIAGVLVPNGRPRPKEE